MDIINDFKFYIDGNGLMTPSPATLGIMRGSDNGPCFSSEFIILSLKNKVDLPLLYPYLTSIDNCINSEQYLVRAPGDNDLGNPDNHYGVYAALIALNIKPIFKFYWKLLRQPQLYFVSLCAHRIINRYNPLQWPLAIITAFVILFSNINDPIEDSNSRRIAWLLIQSVNQFSLLCRLASKVWYARLYKDYGPEGIKVIYGIYFQPNGLNNNPYSAWGITE